MNFYLLLGLSALLAYLCGGINAAIILSHAVYHKDIREFGSKNPGFTNFKRVFGGRCAWFVFVLDLLKTIVPVLCSALLFRHFFGMWQFGAAYAGFFAMLGHAFPVYYGFKGGKAFTAGAAAVWFVDWRMGLIAAAVFLGLLFTVHIMSLASISAAAVCPISLFFLSPSSGGTLLFCFLSATLLIVRHHANIARLIHGKESKIYLFGKKKA